MELESYFDMLAPDDIRIRGHRIGIESILYEYIHRSKTPEEIAVRFDTLTLEQVYATILYYLQNRESVAEYLTRWLEHGENARREQAGDSSFQRLRKKLRKAQSERMAQKAAASATGGE